MSVHCASVAGTPGPRPMRVGARGGGGLDHSAPDGPTALPIAGCPPPRSSGGSAAWPAGPSTLASPPGEPTGGMPPSAPVRPGSVLGEHLRKLWGLITSRGIPRRPSSSPVEQPAPASQTLDRPPTYTPTAIPVAGVYDWRSSPPSPREAATLLDHPILGRCELVRIEGTDWIIRPLAEDKLFRLPSSRRHECQVVQPPGIPADGRPSPDALPPPAVVAEPADAGNTILRSVSGGPSNPPATAWSRCTWTPDTWLLGLIR